MLFPREATFAAALALASGAGAARAQTAQPAQTSSSDEVAREHFRRGRDAFSQGDFATAARSFDQAYQLSRRPQLLYNIGTAYERLHNWNEALVAFRRYLDLVPDAPDRAEVEARIRVIEVEVQHQAEAQQSAEATPTTRVVVVERPAAPVDPPRPWRTLFWVSGGLTVVAGGVTLAVGLLADQRYNSLAANCGQTQRGCDADDIDDMRLRQTLVNVGIVATSVFAAATVTSFVLDQLRPAPRPVGPLPPPQGPSARAGFVPLQGGGLFAVEGTL